MDRWILQCVFHCKLLTHLWCFLEENFHQTMLQERYLLQHYSEQHQTYLQGCFLTWNWLQIVWSVAKHVKISRQSNSTGASVVPLIEYAQLIETLADCELIFKMACDITLSRYVGLNAMFPLMLQQDSSLLQRNSPGYNDKVESANQDVMKRLLNSFLPDFEVFAIPQCHRFGNANYVGPVLQKIALQCSVSQQIGTLINSFEFRRR